MEEFLMSETKKTNKKHETVYVGSMELLQILARKNMLHYLKSVKFKDNYPLFGFIDIPKVTKIVNAFAEEHCGSTEHTVDDVSLWKDHADFITKEVKDVDKTITRNINILKDIVLSGNAYRINKIFVDKSGKRVFRFYSCPEIEKIKAEGDKASHERWEKKQKNTKDDDKPVNDTMKKLIDKAMAEASNGTE